MVTSFETVPVAAGLPVDTRWRVSGHADSTAVPGQLTVKDFEDLVKTVGNTKYLPSGTPVAFKDGKLVKATGTLFSGFLNDDAGVDVTNVKTAQVAVLVKGLVNLDYLPAGAKAIVEAADAPGVNTAKVRGSFVFVTNKEGA